MEKNVTIRISESTAEKYVELYEKTTTGAQIAANTYLIFRTRTLFELKGVFTEEEITGLASSFNGTMREESFMTKPVLIAHLEDSESLEDMSSFYKFNFNEFITKVKALTEVQAYFLMDRIFVFWERECSVKENSLENLIKDFKK